MNKKIFTLFMGAFLAIGSLFTVKAQSTVPFPYVNKYVDGSAASLTVANEVAFCDSLSVSPVKTFESKYNYVISVDGIANVNGAFATQFAAALKNTLFPASGSQMVMFVDSAKNNDLNGMYLRLDTIANLENYKFPYYNGDVLSKSTKWGAIRRASWCITNAAGNVSGSNRIWDFKNMETGTTLEAPLWDLAEQNSWTRFDGDGNRIYNDGIELSNEDLIVSGWHFSQTYGSQALQTSMPLYSYIKTDTVLVLVLDTVAGYNKGISTSNQVGGYTVTVKKVSVNDLVVDALGNVNTGSKKVNNVLLFSLKRIDKFVMNANDYNAVNKSITFTPDAYTASVANDGWNPFTSAASAPDPYGKGFVTASEVNDSLYHYGYMQFQSVANVSRVDASTAGLGWLYVDTAFWNYGNNKYIGFNYTAAQRDTIFGTKWGFNSDGTYNVSTLPYTVDTLPSWNSGSPTADHADIVAKYVALVKDSISIRYKDSIMENQSKFRVVYDPFVDSTWINAYQTRVAYPDMTDPQNPVWPEWTVNSFDLDLPNATYPAAYALPSLDILNGTWSDPKFLNQYVAEVMTMHSASDDFHGKKLDVNTGATLGSAHSFVTAFSKSSPAKMDMVMISTADTNAIFANYFGGVGSYVAREGELAHTYGVSYTKAGDLMYQDSLLYIDIQNLDGKYNIATLSQSYKNNATKLDTKISINYGPRCVEHEETGKATIPNNLYLIRNAEGKYLCVPIYSITDSVYWVMPEAGEDPTRMPCYQWAVENVRSSAGSPFSLTNREFERVSIPYAYVSKSNDAPFELAGAYVNASFNTKVVYAGVYDSLGVGACGGDRNEYGAIEYADGIEAAHPLTDKVSFISLGKDVKSDNLLGYTYVDKDSTIVDVYALRNFHFMGTGENAHYIGWNGYDDPTDTILRVNAQDYVDQLYFDLNEMPWSNINGYNGQGDTKIAITSTNHSGYENFWSKYGLKQNNYTNNDSLVMEKYGYMTNKISNLKPLIRQAYRMLLKDYYKFSPTIQGDYFTVGEQDHYVLADKLYASKAYTPANGNVAGVFGIPYFYFRNTYFNIYEDDNASDDHTYFALVQRLDTVSYEDESGTTSKWADIKEYLTLRFGATAANRVAAQVEQSHELGAFIAVLDDYTADLKMAVRGDAAIRVSTFRLEQDQDPIYRRFHWNDYFDRTYTDEPQTLEFHRLNKGDLDVALYENSGNYSDVDQNSLYGADGGRIYNKLNNGTGAYLRDTIKNNPYEAGNPISFLGISNMDQYPNTNRAFYVDTAFINRGTGWIKPQYMLVVDPYKVQETCGGSCDPSTGSTVTPKTPENYLIGRYLYNTAMYTKKTSETIINKDYKEVAQKENFNMVKQVDMGTFRNPNGKAYTIAGGTTTDKWDRLAFSWAIHKGDSLYILKGAEPIYGGDASVDAERVYETLTQMYGGTSYIDFNKMLSVNTVGTFTDTYYPGYNSGAGETRDYRNYKSIEQLRKEFPNVENPIGLQAIIALNDNSHKDWVFSFRFIERNSDDFVIESETGSSYARDMESGPVIRPGYGGWVKYQNGVPVITRSDEKELMAEGLILNVKSVSNPVSNEEVGSNVATIKVVGGTGSVSIMNAAGKKVVISNMLGQTVANTVLSSDNASIAVPAGVVVVAVEGESAVKAIVK